MSVHIVFGGQYGSESKGKVSNWLVNKLDATAVLRPGGPNSGHTAYDKEGKKHVLRQIPAGCVGTSAIAIIPAGAYIIPELLLQECKELGLNNSTLYVDYNTMIIEDEDYLSEESIGKTISSTRSGTGAALIRRIGRKDVRLARDIAELRPYVCDTRLLIRKLLEGGTDVVVEGTQGWGLSVYHTKCYPYATARDVGAAGLLSECGLSPFDVSSICMVLRTFPIRVAGTSGPLANEITWDTVTQESGSNVPIVEYTSVTKKVRRVGRFDPILVNSAIRGNNPNVIFLNHVDYFDMANSGSNILSDKQLSKINEIEKQIGRKVNYVGNGPNTMLTLNEFKFGEVKLWNSVSR